MKLFMKKLLTRCAAFYIIRFFLILKKPSLKQFQHEAYNAYNGKKDIPRLFVEENSRIPFKQGMSTLEKVLLIGSFIKENYKGGPALGYSSEETLTVMKNNKGGVCGDYSQVFINFCILNNIKVREWGVHDKIYKNKVGHVFNEVFIEETGKWMCIDISKSIYFISLRSGRPVSVTETVDAIGSDENSIAPVSFISDNLKLDYKKISGTFFNPSNLFFLVSGYKIGKMDRVLKMRKKLPIPLLHFLLIFKNDYFKYVPYINEKNYAIVNEKIKWAFKHYAPLLMPAPQLQAAALEESLAL